MDLQVHEQGTSLEPDQFAAIEQLAKDRGRDVRVEVFGIGEGPAAPVRVVILGDQFTVHPDGHVEPLF